MNNIILTTISIFNNLEIPAILSKVIYNTKLDSEFKSSANVA